MVSNIFNTYAQCGDSSKDVHLTLCGDVSAYISNGLRL